MTAARRARWREILRFLAAGGVNTVVSLLLYWALLPWLAPGPAYAICYAAGIVLSYVLNTAFVFRVPTAWRSFLPYPLVYVGAYAAGAVVLHVAINRLGIDPRIAPLLAIAATVPTTYLLARALLHRDKPTPPA